MGGGAVWQVVGSMGEGQHEGWGSMGMGQHGVSGSIGWVFFFLVLVITRGKFTKYYLV